MRGQSYEFSFDLLNEDSNDATICVEGKLSLMLEYPSTGLVSVLMPYYGSISHGCAEEFLLGAGRRKAYVLHLTVSRVAPVGSAVVVGRMALSTGNSGSYQTLVVRTWNVEVLGGAASAPNP